MPHKTVKKDGVTIPSVTTIINVLDKPGLVYWYGKNGTAECNRIKEESATFGTHVHSLIETYLNLPKKPDEEVLEYSDAEKACLRSFIEWYKTSGLTPLCMEPEDAVISKEFNYQGTWDFIGRHDNAVIVADWKTSNALYDTVGLQLAAYAQLYGESQGLTGNAIWRLIPHGMAVRIDKKTAKVQVKMYKDLIWYFDVFKSLILPYQFVSHTGAWSHEKEDK
jgi:hypothetical protein